MWYAVDPDHKQLFQAHKSCKIEQERLLEGGYISMFNAHKASDSSFFQIVIY